MRHHAIVVTSDDKKLKDAHAQARKVFGAMVSGVVNSSVNDYGSFLIAPDGSKERWAESDEGDARRAVYKDWLDAQRYDDGTSAIAWVEVQYGDDERETRIVADSDHRSV